MLTFYCKHTKKGEEVMGPKSELLEEALERYGIPPPPTVYCEYCGSEMAHHVVEEDSSKFNIETGKPRHRIKCAYDCPENKGHGMSAHYANGRIVFDTCCPPYWYWDNLGGGERVHGQVR